MLSAPEEVSYFIGEGDSESVKLIFEKNPQLFLMDHFSDYSFLHYCARHNIATMVQYLLEKGCYINEQDDVLGRTPLMLAVQSGSTEVAKKLLSAGADIGVILDNNEQSVLHLTFAEHKMPPEFLLELITEFGKQFITSEIVADGLIHLGCHLYQAVCSKDVKIVEYLINHGYPVQSMHPKNKLTALHYAVYCEDTEIVKLLLRHGAAGTALDVMGRTPLFYLYHDNPKHNPEKLDILKIFLDSGIFIESSNPANVIFQVSNILGRGSQNAIRLVLQSCPDFAIKDKLTGKTILHYLAENRNAGVIEELKTHVHKFDINAVDEMRCNSLYLAAKAKNIDMVQYLLEQGAAVNSTRHVTMFPPLYCAFTIKSSFQSARLIELLLQHNEDAQFILTKKKESNSHNL